MDGAKKPKANSPPSDMTVVPGNSGLPGTSRSSEVRKAGKRRRTAVQIATELMNAIEPHVVLCASSSLSEFNGVCRKSGRELYIWAQSGFLLVYAVVVYIVLSSYTLDVYAPMQKFQICRSIRS